MQSLFLELVQLSLTGSLFALAVMLVRIVFRKAPKWIFCLLWGVVALRLICPISIESSFSLIPDTLASGQIITNVGNDYVGEVKIIYENNAGYSDALEAGRQPIYSGNGCYVVTKKDSYDAPATVEKTVFPILSRIWFSGMVLMLAYTIISYALLKRKMEEATLLRENIWQCEQVASPFVLGIIKPRIYLPYQITESDMENVIAHEQAHIRRGDHWWKPVGFLLLSVHWFNPVMWIAYILLCRDIEAACDEKVIKHMEKEEMRAYSTALLHCSVHRRRIAACPLAFGEVGVKGRIRRVMNYKKPAFWIIILVIAVSVAAGVLFLTSPTSADTEDRPLQLAEEIVNNPECASSSNPYTYIAAKQEVYDEILSYGDSTVSCFVDRLRSGENGLRGYIMAVACAEITGIGSKQHGAAWATAQEWLSLYDSADRSTDISKVTATDYFSGQQAKLLSFGYSARPGEEGIAAWQRGYSEEETLVLDGKNGENQILLAPRGFKFSRYRIYLPDGTVYDDGTRTLYDSLGHRVMFSEKGIFLIAPFRAGEYIYEVELIWPERNMTVTYGLKVVMTGKESAYDAIIQMLFDQFGNGSHPVAVSFVNRFSLANAVTGQEYYVFDIENLPGGTKRVAVSTDGKTMYEMSPENELDILASKAIDRVCRSEIEIEGRSAALRLYHP